jgi:8-oxo-dGTP diphosphatase
MECLRPHVGVNVFILRDGKVLFGKRKGSHGEGSWAPPGGKLDFGEDLFECARREVKEETGMEIEDLKLGPYTNDYFEKDKLHYITVYISAMKSHGEPKVLEPHKCTEWKWFEWDKLPNELFLTIQNLKKQNYDPFK